ncbi:antibiotic ABC transporter ATP-binding protein [Peribacillus muralis]|uniref:Antibiotic ABC transporter ATP-binding protein n=1 Tax=Peribacillus muralis TaxID=264697 RepID=A0A1B3XJ41_9BACI|nr:ABC transporter ATP-binding protein [Peribacillus muralis]AOH53179.1 antibiotic ABC transporter ATP-binding protein [Peribacillus muralis]
MLEVRGIKKSFGKKVVVGGVSFSVEKGESFGLLGPNGAGKSTTIAMLCGLLPYEEGEILIDGLSVKKSPRHVKKKIGIVPQEIALYHSMSAIDNLLFWGRMYGLTRAKAKKMAEVVLEIVGLKDRAKHKIETFSGGMKRRINIGAALMHEPELLIMDEPTVGIDPQSRNHILETVKKLNADGMTVIYTSHYMEEVEYICDRICIVDEGKIIALGRKEELFGSLKDGVVITLHVNSLEGNWVKDLEQIASVEKVIANAEKNSLEIVGNNHANIVSDIISCAVKANVKVSSFERKEPNLESLFLQLTGRSLRD